MTTAVQILNFSVTPEKPKTSGSFFDTLNEWVGKSSGAYDLMNTLKKLAVFMGNGPLAQTFGAYTAATCVPRLPGALHDLRDHCYAVRDEGLSSYNAIKVCHGITEVGAMTAFSANLVNPFNQTAGNVGAVLNSASDVADVPTYMTDMSRAKKLLAEAKRIGSSPEVTEGLQAKQTYSMIKLVKACCSAVTGIFASYALATGVCILTAGTALTLSLASSFCNIAAFYQKECFSDYFAKVSVSPISKQL